MPEPHHQSSSPDVKAEIAQRLAALGFNAVAVCAPGAIPEAAGRLAMFLEAGRHGTMDWLAANEPRRADPRVLWPEAKSVIIAAMNYGPKDDPMAQLGHRDRAVISAYAKGADYHDVMKKRLKQVARWLHQSSGADVKIFVDTAPVMEKPLAAAAGIGWQGKHTNLVSREFGSWLFLGAIFTTLELAPDAAEADHCGSCRNCLDICPTNAFPAPYQLDARRCISYLTIEHKGPIPLEFRRPMGNRIYGCDDCLAVCPWNKFAAATREFAFLPRAELSAPRLADLARLDDATFRTVFAGSPIKRIGRDRFLRNVLIAIGNALAAPDVAPHAASTSHRESHAAHRKRSQSAPTASPGGEAAPDELVPADEREPLIAAVANCLADPAPLVRAMAAWAIGELRGTREGDRLFERYRSEHEPGETDETVRAEWARHRPKLL